MKFRCINKAMLHGEVIKVDQVVDITEGEVKSDIVKANFVALEADAPSMEGALAKLNKEAQIVAGLTRAQAMAKLQEARVIVNTKATDEEIKGIYEAAFDDIGSKVGKKRAAKPSAKEG